MTRVPCDASNESLARVCASFLSLSPSRVSEITNRMEMTIATVRAGATRPESEVIHFEWFSLISLQVIASTHHKINLVNFSSPLTALSLLPYDKFYAHQLDMYVCVVHSLTKLVCVKAFSPLYTSEKRGYSGKATVERVQ